MDIYAIRRANLRAVIEERYGGIDRTFALAHGAEPNYVSRLFTENPRWRKNIGDELARRWEKELELPEHWFDHVHQVREDLPGYANARHVVEPSATVPLISWVQAGRPMPAETWDPETLEHLLVARKYGPRAYALRVRGDSMVDPTSGKGFPEGCYIVVDPDGEARHGSYVIVRFTGSDEATFKQLIHDGPRRLLRPSNPRYPIIEMNGEAEIVGVVREKVHHEVLP
jgi:SOS-response transcriptional repressor LexA